MSTTRLKALRKDLGFTILEILIVVAGAAIILSMGVPVLNTVLEQYQVTLGAQSIVTQLQSARMKAVASNESFDVFFPDSQRRYQIQNGGNVMAGPFYLPSRINWNSTDPGSAVSFPGRFVSFLPTGNVPSAGNGSSGRVKIISPSGIRIDVVVNSGGIIRQTPPYRTPPAPF